MTLFTVHPWMTLHRTPKQVAVYFGGDIRDLPEAMRIHRDHRHHTKYNLIATASLLSTQFPSHHIVVVRPSRMQMSTFSCFDNFVPGTNNGAPEHTPNHNALNHLELILKNLSAEIGSKRVHVEMGQSLDEGSFVSSTTEETGKTPRDNPHLDRADITLIGFSKGSVVLNQFLYEFHYLKTLTPDDDSMSEFLSRISHMYWLDGGHNGGKNTFITARSLLETLKRLNIRVHVHMTPYQLDDERRPWLAKEEKMFSDNLRVYGARVYRFFHFDGESPSLDMHFRILEEFMGVEDDEGDVEEEEIDEDDDMNSVDTMMC